MTDAAVTRQVGQEDDVRAGQTHWDQVYATRRADEVSWYEACPAASLEMIRATGCPLDAPIIDIGGGLSSLVDELLATGHTDITILDVSALALRQLAERLGERAACVQLLRADVTAFRPTRRYALWHDRAVFHFLVDPEDRQRYVEVLKQGLARGGHAVIATFGPQGPTRCSGLPVMRHDAASLARELGDRFELESSTMHVHRTPAGRDQQFIYGRFRRTARRD